MGNYWVDELHPDPSRVLSGGERFLLRRRRERAIRELLAEREAEARRHRPISTDLVAFAEQSAAEPMTDAERTRLLGASHLGRVILKNGQGGQESPAEDRSEHAGMTRGERDQLLGMTPLGRAALADRRAKERAAQGDGREEMKPSGMDRTYWW